MITGIIITVCIVAAFVAGFIVGAYALSWTLNDNVKKRLTPEDQALFRELVKRSK